MKNLHHPSARGKYDYYQDQSKRRYPFLGAIDLLLSFGLSVAALALTVIALLMVLDAALPTLARMVLIR